MKYSLECAVITIICACHFLSVQCGSAQDAYSSGNNPCCLFPCQNGGVCMTTGYDNYTCDCTGLDYFGDQCENPKFFRRIVEWIRPSKETLQYAATHHSWIWSIVNQIRPLHNFIMKYIYLSRANIIDSPPRYGSNHDYITLDTYYNTSLYARSLPPVPKNCPTPMGVAGKKDLPNVDMLIDKFFRRKTFSPDPHRSNLLFSYYAQHFTHQFFRTNWKEGPGFTTGSEGVDVSHIYGSDQATRDQLRSFKNGKLKSQILNGEEYPPFLKDAPVPMSYPPDTTEAQKFALGHPFYGLLPGLFAYATIWLREHNRVCQVLQGEHPEWDDEQIYQTARLILLGETLKITIEDYVQHLSQYNLRLTFEPDLLQNQKFQFSNRIRVEFNHLYHWHPLFPDVMSINNEKFTLESLLFRVDVVLQHGLTKFVDALIREPAGAMTHHNHATILLPILEKVISHGRQLRLQPFNEYRKRFGLKPYSSFLELTGDAHMAEELEEVYGSVDALEFYPGLMFESPGASVTPPTMVEIGGPYSVKGLMANPICSPQYWKPSTFGGDIGFDIVRTASLEKLFCRNLKNVESCEFIAFALPEDVVTTKRATDEL